MKFGRNILEHNAQWGNLASVCKVLRTSGKILWEMNTVHLVGGQLLLHTLWQLYIFRKWSEDAWRRLAHCSGVHLHLSFLQFLQYLWQKIFGKIQDSNFFIATCSFNMIHPKFCTFHWYFSFPSFHRHCRHNALLNKALALRKDRKDDK